MRKPGPDTRARILGSHVHAGIQAALLLNFDSDAPGLADYVHAAVIAVRRYNRETLNPDQQIYDYEARQMVPDVAYRYLMDDVLAQAIAIVRYQIPRIGLGVRYKVASVAEVIGLGADPTEGTPMVEWQFAEPFKFNSAQAAEGDDYIITGTVDTVLRDLRTGEYLLVDWKTRGVMPDARLVDMDGQLKLYAAIVNRLAGREVIARTCQYQIRNTVPKPAVLTEKKREVSTAAISSTWPVWSESVRALGIDPEKFREKMADKMHPETDFTWPVFTPVMRASSRSILQNVLLIGEAIRSADSRAAWPAAPSLIGCQFCEFKALCRVKDDGGDVEFVTHSEYTHSEIVDDELVPEEV